MISFIRGFNASLDTSKAVVTFKADSRHRSRDSIVDCRRAEIQCSPSSETRRIGFDATLFLVDLFSCVGGLIKALRPNSFTADLRLFNSLCCRDFSSSFSTPSLSLLDPQSLPSSTSNSTTNYSRNLPSTMKFTILALSALLALAAAADSTSSEAAKTTSSAEVECAKKCEWTRSDHLGRLLTLEQATPRTSAVSPHASRCRAPATTRPTTPTSVYLPAPRALAPRPTPRNTPTVSRNASVLTSSPPTAPPPLRPARRLLLPVTAVLPASSQRPPTPSVSGQHDQRERCIHANSIYSVG